MDDDRVLYAAGQLLDRQLIDANDHRCGKIDDLELSEFPDGSLRVTVILTGPGALANRLGHHRLGNWLRSFVVFAGPEQNDTGRIDISHVIDLADHVTLNIDAEQLAGFLGERWVRDHIIRHIPGGRREDQ